MNRYDLNNMISRIPGLERFDSVELIEHPITGWTRLMTVVGRSAGREPEEINCCVDGRPSMERQSEATAWALRALGAP
jgi:hypothetical protein